MRIMFADEARFGRINRPRPCWAPIGVRPEVASQLIREYIYLYGAVSPRDGTCVYLIMPRSDTACFQAFLNVLSRKFAGQDILLVLDGAPNHRCSDLALPANISLLFLFLLGGQIACAPAHIEAGQAFDPALFEEPAPAAHGVVIEQKRIGDLLTAPPGVQKHLGVRTPRHPARRRRIARQRRQRLAIFFAEEARLNHAHSRIRLIAKRKKFVPALQ